MNSPFCDAEKVREKENQNRVKKYKSSMCCDRKYCKNINKIR